MPPRTTNATPLFTCSLHISGVRYPAHQLTSHNALEGIFLKSSDNKYKATISSPKISTLSRRALNLAVVRMFTCICFSFSRMGICTKFGPGTSSLPSDHAILILRILGNILSPAAVW